MLSKKGAQVRIAAIGGTFDTLHPGHKEYIQLAFEYADRVIIYVNSDDYVTPKKSYEVLKFGQRVYQLKNYISSLGISKDFYEIRQLTELKCVEYDYLNEKIDLAIITPEYYHLLRRLNQQRLDAGKNPVMIIVKERTRDTNNSDISSSAIRHALLEKTQGSLN